ncbi:unnamed protein product [Cuscuta epithymum]|uniref:F-box domain-containing protein n=1 Tax=Cuscuta epithymum TaxID=186058 RepID=A0AAV0C601_9ASTE|nr:unnamed protein product [Cuscuta epithymum]
MKGAGMESGIPFLPEEIITDILKRLSVKSLHRCQSVCHLWRNLIKVPSFIIDHLNRSNQQIPSLITRFRGTSKLNSLDLDMVLHEVQDGPPIYIIGASKIVCSCNGLLCVEIRLSRPPIPPTLSIWNPAIGEYMQVPTIRRVNADVSNYHLSFGFRPFVNVYKIVLICEVLGEVVVGVQVYSLTTNSWKDIEFGNLEGKCWFHQSITVNGSVFWFIQDGRRNANCI